MSITVLNWDLRCVLSPDSILVFGEAATEYSKPSFNKFFKLSFGFGGLVCVGFGKKKHPSPQMTKIRLLYFGGKNPTQQTTNKNQHFFSTIMRICSWIYASQALLNVKKCLLKCDKWQKQDTQNYRR